MIWAILILLAVSLIITTFYGRRHPGSWAWRNLAAKRKKDGQ